MARQGIPQREYTERPVPVRENYTLFQGFEWDVPADRQHWNRLRHVLPQLKHIGIDNIWLPPACKGGAPTSNGYDIYDSYDLGEFVQKGSRSTKWGSKEDLLQFAHEARRLGIGLYFDAVFNHRCGGDATEPVVIVAVDPKDRTKAITKPIEIQPWLKFTFPGRNGAYSPFTLSWRQFNATDYDQVTGKKAIFRIVSGGKTWAQDVDNSDYVNGDYLMLNNMDYSNLPLREDMKYWGYWVTRELGLSGFRLDATNHVSQGFTNEWIAHVNAAAGRRLFYVGEFWSGDVKLLLNWLSKAPRDFHLFDVPLFYNLAKLSFAANPDLRLVFHNTLVTAKPHNAVTFIMNHDTQKGQSMAFPINHLFIAHAYALILLRQSGYPCIFYGDLYGTCDPHPPHQPAYGKLADLALARKLYAYGEQTDYFDRPDCIGWVRMGAGTAGPASHGMAVLVSWVRESLHPSTAALHDMSLIADANRHSGASDGSAMHERVRRGFHLARRSWHGTHGNETPVVAPRPALAASPRKRMFVGRHRAGEVWRDLLGWEWAEVRIDREGWGVFPCQKNSVAVFVAVGAEGRERFPVAFDTGIYRRT